MAKPSVNSLMISASIWTLVQSILYVVVASIGIMAYGCGFDMTGNSVIYAIYVVYFFNRSCGSTINLNLLTSSSQGLATLVATPFTAERTLRWMILQLIFACVWLVTSLLMMVGSLNRVYGGYSLFFCGPWLVSAFLAVFADAIACVTYLSDIAPTQEITLLLHYIGAIAPGTVREESGSWTASALMATLFGRGFVIWIVNVFFLVVVIRETRQIAAIDMKIPEINGNQQASTKEMKETRTRDWLEENDVSHDSITTSNPIYIDVTKATAKAKGISRTQSSPSLRKKVTLTQRQASLVSDSSMASMTKRLETILDNMVQERRDSATSCNKMYIEPPTPRNSVILHPHEVYVIEEIYNRSLQSEHDADENNQNLMNRKETPVQGKLPMRSSVTVAPVELRGQLPWSYFGDAVPQGMRMRDQLPEDEDLPPVPVPDYTLHYPHRKRREGVNREPSSASRTSNNSDPTIPGQYNRKRSSSNKQNFQWEEVLY